MKKIKSLFTHLVRSYYRNKFNNMTYWQCRDYLIKNPNPSQFYLDALLNVYFDTCGLRYSILREPKIPENIKLLIKSYDKYGHLKR
jgi:hypothetical protein